MKAKSKPPTTAPDNGSHEKGSAPHVVETTYPHPDVKIGEVDHTPTTIPDQPPAALNQTMAAAIGRVQAILQGRGVMSNPAMLLGQRDLKIAQLEESLQVAIDALGELSGQIKPGEEAPE